MKLKVGMKVQGKNGKNKITKISYFKDIHKKIRNKWKINPATKIIKNKKRKTRQQLKRELKEE